MAVNREQFCCCPDEAPVVTPGQSDPRRSRGALLLRAKWTNGSTITVRFLEGDPGLQERIRAVATEWTEIANLKFDFRDRGPTDIRIAFLPGKGSWSHLGTLCKRLPDTKPTMNYGRLKPESSESDLRRVVLHEFGHAIGLIHEHENPKNGAIDWNRDAVIHDLSGPPNNWDLATIEENMFKRYAPSELSGSDVDRHSIMIYPIPLAWTNDGTTVSLNLELSAQDKALVRDLYPR